MLVWPTHDLASELGVCVASRKIVGSLLVWLRASAAQAVCQLSVREHPINGSPTSYSATTGSTRSKLTNKDEIKWQELLSRKSPPEAIADDPDFRSVQARHEKARRQLHSGDLGSNSSIHFSSPSQTYNSAPSTAGIPSNAQLSKSGTLKKKSGSIGGTAPRMSPLNPKRGGSGTIGSGVISPGVSIGGAVASMNGQHGLGGIRPASPSAGGGRRRILGGIRKATGHGSGS